MIYPPPPPPVAQSWKVTKANNTTLKDLLGRAGQFNVPLYQRAYEWEREHCVQLYNDIKEAGERDNGRHFIGAITYVEDLTNAEEISKYQIIDGQQRLVTILMLLSALKYSLDGNETKVTKDQIEYVLFNKAEQDEEYYKLMASEKDNSSLQEIINNGASEEINHVVKNFNLLKKKIENDAKANKHIRDIIWSGFCKLTAVSIHIERKDDDDPQAIFESMNSTGLGLSVTDLIRNYVLMNYSPSEQKEIYEKYWEPMKKLFEDGKDGDDFDEFFQYYLMLYTKSYIVKNNVYAEFKKHAHKYNMKDEIKKICEYSKYYHQLIHATHNTSTIKKRIGYIHGQDTNVANPLLLKVLADHAKSEISEKDVIDIFDLVDSYLLRCKICENDRALNRIFPELLASIDNNTYSKSIEKALMDKDRSSAFPRNAVFKEKFWTFQIYTRRGNLCKYVLERLEHRNDKEGVSTDTLEIEHIMPRTVSDAWKNDLGEGWEDTHRQYKHTIGNLTLTGYNGELGNAPFKDKLKIYEDSKINLSKGITKYDTWGKENIKKRAAELADQAAKLWKCPEGYEGPEEDFDANVDMEINYLSRKNTQELWHTLKQIILDVDNRLKFHMTRVYGSFTILDKTNTRKIGICEMESYKNKIHVVYNCKIKDGVIAPSKFVENISDRGHYCPGDLRSTIISKEDIPRVIANVQKILTSKTIKVNHK